jgi:hypothetical protein
MRDFIERLKSKPEHIRRRIALGTAAGVTGVVTVMWAIALILSGNLAFTSAPNGTGTATLAAAGASTNADGTPIQPVPAKTNFSQLLGAVGISTQAPAAPALTPVDVAPPVATATQPTVIPF